MTLAQLAIQGLSFAALRLLTVPEPSPRDVGAAVFDAGVVILTVMASPVALMTVARTRHFKAVPFASVVRWPLGWLMPVGQWGPQVLVGSFGSAFAGHRQGREAVGMLLTTLKPLMLGAVSGITLQDVQQCDTRDYALGAMCVLHGLLVAVVAPHRIAVLNAPAALSSLVAGAAFILKARGASSDTLSYTVLAGVIINVGGVVISMAATLTTLWAAKQVRRSAPGRDASAVPMLPAPLPREHEDVIDAPIRDMENEAGSQVANPLSSVATTSGKQGSMSRGGDQNAM